MTLDEIFDESKKRSEENPSFVQWSIDARGYRPFTKTINQVPAGYYNVREDSNGLYLFPEEITTDELYPLSDSVEEVIQEINQFWEIGERFKKANFVWKRGVLLYGPPGSGKTSALNRICQSFIKNGGLVVGLGYPNYTMKLLKDLRKIEPDRGIILVFEDLEEQIERWDESYLLSILDGQEQLDKIVNLATTNHLDELPERFANRPSRFDLVVEVDHPTEEVRKEFLRINAPSLTDEEIEYWLRKTKGFSLAHLKELIVSVTLFGKDLNFSLERLNGMITSHSNPIGFCHED